MTLMITGRTERETDRQTDGQTDRVRRNMRPPPREEGRIIMSFHSIRNVVDRGVLQATDVRGT